ncbi:protein of unknown function [Stenotrophomonas maltophilia]|nr:protein of unknown function [Stenotrophomonas maltophilia]
MARPSSSITAPTSSSQVASCQLSDAGRVENGNGKRPSRSANQFCPASFSRPDSKNSQASRARSANGESQRPTASRRGVYTEEAELIMGVSCGPVVDGGHSEPRRYRQRVLLPGVLSATVAVSGGSYSQIQRRRVGRSPGHAQRPNVSNCRNPPPPYSPVQLCLAAKQRRYTPRRKWPLPTPECHP